MIFKTSRREELYQVEGLTILPNQVTFHQGSSYIQSEDIDDHYSYYTT